MPEPAFRGNLYRLRDQFDSGLFIGQGPFPNCSLANENDPNTASRDCSRRLATPVCQLCLLSTHCRRHDRFTKQRHKATLVYYLVFAVAGQKESTAASLQSRIHQSLDKGIQQI